MKALLLLVFACVTGSGLFAQAGETVTIKAGSKIRDVLSPADLFHYPQFTKGRVYFRDGTKAEARLNYRLLGDEMQFIDPRGDTLSLDDEKTIRFIQIDKDTFYYDNGYVKAIGGTGKMKLARKELWVVGDVKKVGAYNTPSSTASIYSYTSYNEGGKTYDLVVNENVVLKKVAYFYFGDQYNHFVLAGKQNLLMLFPKKGGLIKSYLKENKVEFDSKDDLLKLVVNLSTE